jgi:DNA-binding MarR family transcriptional regulator
VPSAQAEQNFLADRLLAAMTSLRRVSRRRARRPTELFSLTGSQLELVRLVRRQPGVSVAEAASDLRLAPNTVSTLVRQLADIGILSRCADVSDRRVAHLDLSKDIRRKVDAWRDRRLEDLSCAIRQLSAREERCLEEATKVLTRLAEQLDAQEQQGQPVSGGTGSEPLPAGSQPAATTR